MLILISGVCLYQMLDNVSEFIAFHNENINSEELTANVEKIETFASRKNIALADLSIEKHRMPFINWCTSLEGSQV